MSTRLRSFDGEVITLPNDDVRSGSIIDRSRRNRYRIEIEVGLDYDTDIERAATVIEETTTEVEDVAAMPEPNAVTKRFGDSAVVLGLRYWIRNPSMRKRWRTQTAAMNAIKPALDEEGIVIPFPQQTLSARDVDASGPQLDASVEGARRRAAGPTRARTMAPTPRATPKDRGVGPMTGDDRDAGSGLAERRGLDEAVVYQPAEDSGLLAEAALEEAHGRVLEVGTGSGWVAQQIAEERGLDTVGSDLNPHAARQARERGVEGVVADLLSPYRADAFDTVCFNPLSPDRPGQRVGRLDGTRALGRRVGPRTHRAVPRRRGARPRAGRRRPASSLVADGVRRGARSRGGRRVRGRAGRRGVVPVRDAHGVSAASGVKWALSLGGAGR